MASLTRGISFRRQGSSGSTWTYNEEGILVRLPKPEGHASNGAAGSLARIHNWQGTEKNLPKQGHPAGSKLERSKSVGWAPTKSSPVADPPQKPSRFRLRKWIKKTLNKLKS